MKLRYYHGLDPDTIPNFKRFAKAIKADQFAQADIKKIGDNLFRAKLGRSARLLFAFHSHAGQTDCLVLEHLPNHDYEKSRFLTRGVVVDEDRIVPLEDVSTIEPEPLVYLNPNNDRFHVLDKVLSFDDEQEAIFQLPPPLVLVGSAGSGKTALTLTKMRQAIGDVLYISLSPYLVDSARALYFANGYRNEDQTLDFLSLAEFMESIAVPEGREATYQDFDAWFQRHKAGSAKPASWSCRASASRPMPFMTASCSASPSPGLCSTGMPFPNYGTRRSTGATRRICCAVMNTHCCTGTNPR